MHAVTLKRLCFRAIALVPFVAVGCQAIAGIEERRYVQPLEGGTAESGPKPSPACETYCNHVMANCTKEDAVYTDIKACYGVCAKLVERNMEGDFDEHGGNTVACRDFQAVNAGLGETNSFCPNAGPGGGTTCGPDCESYCLLYADTCSDVFPPLDNCLSACAVLRRSPQFSSVNDYSGDTLDCRLVHVSVATTNNELHCPHARIVPPTDPCQDKSDKPPSCEDYCRTSLGACGVGGTDGGSLAVYESPQQCMDVCVALDLGTNNQQDGNTVGCRLYHSYNALAGTAGPVMHCAHTSPTGDGHCADPATATDRASDNCDPYCQIVAKACPAEFKAHFGPDPDHVACHAECAKLSGVEPNSGYTVHMPDGPTVQCRVKWAARAFQKRADCAAALGEETCK